MNLGLNLAELGGVYSVAGGLVRAGLIIANELLLSAGFGVVWKMSVAVIVGVIPLLIGMVTRPASDTPNWTGRMDSGSPPG